MFITKHFLKIMFNEYKEFEILLKNQQPGENQKKEVKNYVNYFKRSGMSPILMPEVIERHFRVK
jgi:hypothetical protein